mgnify:CR=1 FL=1
MVGIWFWVYQATIMAISLDGSFRNISSIRQNIWRPHQKKSQPHGYSKSKSCLMSCSRIGGLSMICVGHTSFQFSLVEREKYSWVSQQGFRVRKSCRSSSTRVSSIRVQDNLVNSKHRRGIIPVMTASCTNDSVTWKSNRFSISQPHAIAQGWLL